MTAAIFNDRPPLDAEYRDENGSVFRVAASWPGGVVFEGCHVVSVKELAARFRRVNQSQEDMQP